jgi:hypothetical protein
LTIRVAPQIASLRGLVVERSNLPLARGAWNVPVPIDGGVYSLVVSAPGYRAWRATVSVEPERDRVTVDVGPDTLVAVEPKAVAVPVSREPRANATPAAWSRTRWLGVGYAATGVVSLGLSGFVLLRALDKKEESDRACSGRDCSEPAAQAAREDARRLGDWATGFSIAGGALVATGVTLFLVGGAGTAERGTTVGLGGDVTGPRLAVSGRF